MRHGSRAVLLAANGRAAVAVGGWLGKYSSLVDWLGWQCKAQKDRNIFLSFCEPLEEGDLAGSLQAGMKRSAVWIGATADLQRVC